MIEADWKSWRTQALLPILVAAVLAVAATPAEANHRTRVVRGQDYLFTLTLPAETAGFALSWAESARALDRSCARTDSIIAALEHLHVTTPRLRQVKTALTGVFKYGNRVLGADDLCTWASRWGDVSRELYGHAQRLSGCRFFCLGVRYRYTFLQVDRHFQPDLCRIMITVGALVRSTSYSALGSSGC